MRSLAVLAVALLAVPGISSWLLPTKDVPKNEINLRPSPVGVPANDDDQPQIVLRPVDKPSAVLLPALDSPADVVLRPWPVAEQPANDLPPVVVLPAPGLPETEDRPENVVLPGLVEDEIVPEHAPVYLPSEVEPILVPDFPIAMLPPSTASDENLGDEPVAVLPADDESPPVVVQPQPDEDEDKELPPVVVLPAPAQPQDPPTVVVPIPAPAVPELPIGILPPVVGESEDGDHGLPVVVLPAPADPDQNESKEDEAQTTPQPDSEGENGSEPIGTLPAPAELECTAKVISVLEEVLDNLKRDYFEE